MHQLVNLLAQEEEGMITMVHEGCWPRFVTNRLEFVTKVCD